MPIPRVCSIAPPADSFPAPAANEGHSACKPIGSAQAGKPSIATLALAIADVFRKPRLDIDICFLPDLILIPSSRKSKWLSANSYVHSKCWLAGGSSQVTARKREKFTYANKHLAISLGYAAYCTACFLAVYTTPLARTINVIQIDSSVNAA